MIRSAIVVILNVFFTMFPPNKCLAAALHGFIGALQRTLSPVACSKQRSGGRGSDPLDRSADYKNRRRRRQQKLPALAGSSGLAQSFEIPVVDQVDAQRNECEIVNCSDNL